MCCVSPQDLVERERCNQDAIEEERAGLMKLKEVYIINQTPLFAVTPLTVLFTIFLLHRRKTMRS